MCQLEHGMYSLKGHFQNPSSPLRSKGKGLMALRRHFIRCPLCPLLCRVSLRVGRVFGHLGRSLASRLSHLPFPLPTRICLLRTTGQLPHILWEMRMMRPSLLRRNLFLLPNLCFSVTVALHILHVLQTVFIFLLGKVQLVFCDACFAYLLLSWQVIRSLAISISVSFTPQNVYPTVLCILQPRAELIALLCIS